MYTHSLCIQDLPFKRGDTLVIISASKDPNWYKARRSDGLDGMIPYNYVQRKSDTSSTNPPAPPSSARPQAGAVLQQKGSVTLHSMP